MAGLLAGLGPMLSLRGRCSRALNGWFQAITFGICLAAFVIWATVGLPVWLTLIVLVIALWPIGLTFTVRRLHDVGLSGWFILLCLIPILGVAFTLSVIFKRGQVGPNRYGDDPLKLKARRPSRPGLEWSLAVLGCMMVIAALVGLRTFAFAPFVDPSEAMEPSLNKGDYFIVSKFAYGFSRYSLPFSPPLFHGRLFNQTPHRGDIIVFKLPRDQSTDYIKRLVGLPGDKIQIKSGVIFVNDRPIAHDKVGEGIQRTDGVIDHKFDIYKETTLEGRSYMTKFYERNGATENTGVYVAPPKCYFLLGDNRDDSLDSRFDPDMASVPVGPSNCGWDTAVDAYVPTDSGVGYVPEENLVGRAVLAVALGDKPRWRWLGGR